MVCMSKKPVYVHLRNERLTVNLFTMHNLLLRIELMSAKLKLKTPKNGFQKSFSFKRAKMQYKLPMLQAICVDFARG